MKYAPKPGLLLALCVACSTSVEDAGTGSVSFSTWGEEYIEEGLPTSVFEDGWSVKYNKFLVVLGDVVVADDKGVVAASMKSSVLVDHVTAGVKPVVTFQNLPARAWNRVSYSIAPAGNTTVLEGAKAEDLIFMKDAGYSLYVEGTASKGSTQKRIRWGFTISTQFERCRGEVGGKETEGAVVTRGGTDGIELTIHGDHLFYDDLQSQGAKVRFGAIADADDRATGDRDGSVSLEELAKFALVEIPAAQGGYGTGAISGVNDLRDFVTSLSRTVGHFRGEGECFTPSK